MIIKRYILSDGIEIIDEPKKEKEPLIGLLSRGNLWPSAHSLLSHHVEC
jgi:hypothetical protein